MLFWAVFLALVAVLVAWLVREWRRRHRPPPEAVAREPSLPADIAGEIPDPDELAREGRYAEAVHAMLLRAIRELALSRPRELPPAMTSREILRDSRLADEPARELRGIVIAVEVSRFGGADVDRGDYSLVNERYLSFLTLLRGAAA